MKKVAFVCSGGGAKGSFEVGVLKQLADKGIVPDVLYGTSTGALNSAGYAFVGIDQLMKVWLGIRSTKDIMVQRPWFLLPFYLFLLKGKGVSSMDPLEKKIKQMIQGQPKKECNVCMVSLRTSKKIFIKAEPGMSEDQLKDFQEAVLASASTPILNDVVDKEYVDGGVRQITPLSPAIKDGATDIYVILAEPYSPDVQFSGEIGNVIDVFNRTIGCMVQEMFWQDIKMCSRMNKLSKINKGLRKINFTIYAPDKSLIDAGDFDPVKIEASVRQGLNAVPVYQE